MPRRETEDHTSDMDFPAEEDENTGLSKAPLIERILVAIDVDDDVSGAKSFKS